jgi:hypothetical protein
VLWKMKLAFFFSFCLYFIIFTFTYMCIHCLCHIYPSCFRAEPVLPSFFFLIYSCIKFYSFKADYSEIFRPTSVVISPKKVLSTTKDK